MTVNAVGAGLLVPEKLPLNPNVVEPFGASVRFQSRFVAVTLPLPAACAQVALQPGGVNRWPPVKVNASVQPLIVAVPELTRVMFAVKPPPPPQF